MDSTLQLSALPTLCVQHSVPPCDAKDVLEKSYLEGLQASHPKLTSIKKCGDERKHQHILVSLEGWFLRTDPQNPHQNANAQSSILLTLFTTNNYGTKCS